MDRLGSRELDAARRFARDYWWAVAEIARHNGAAPLLVAPFGEKFVRNLNRHVSRPVAEADIVFGYDEGLMSTGKKFYIFTDTGIHSSKIGYVDYGALSDLHVAYEEVRKPTEFAVHNKVMVNGRELIQDYRYSSGLVMEDFLWRFASGRHEVDLSALELILSPRVEGIDEQAVRANPNAINLLMRLGLEPGENILSVGPDFTFTNRRTIRHEWASIKLFRNADIRHLRIADYRLNVHTDLVGGFLKLFFDTAKDVVEAVSNKTYNIQIKCESGETFLLMDISHARKEALVEGATLAGVAIKRVD